VSPPTLGRSLLVLTNWRDGRHPEAGGAEEVCEQLAVCFARHGWEVVLLTSAIDGRASRESRDGFEIIRRGGRFTVYPWTLLWIAWHRRSIRAVIDSQNGIPFFTPLVVSKRTPVLLLLHHVHHALFPHYFSPLAARVGQWLESSGSRLVYGDRAVVAVSPSTRRGARRDFRLRGEIFVVPPGCRAMGSERPGKRPRSVYERIVWVGSLVPQKRVGLILDAMPELLAAFPRLELHLVGDGPERGALVAQAQHLGLVDHVTFHGSLDQEARDEQIRAAWLSVTASESEGWGPGVIQCNAQGVPMLAYRRPGLRDSIRHHDTGWLIDEDQPLAPAVAEALRMLADPEFAEGIGVRAQRWVSRFTWDEMAKQIVDILLAEEGRLRHRRDDRRSRTDLSTVAVVPFDLLPEGHTLHFRPTDRSLVGPDGLVLLLRGTDTESARTALRRAGLSESAVNHPSVQTMVARPRDLVSLDATMDASSALSPIGDARTHATQTDKGKLT
jgi:glycosyltransferase involved in cell wall biosynthesis